MLDKIGHENMVHDILERKNAFLHNNKNKKLKKEEKLGFFQSG